jgi:hypothetical protein
MMSEAPEHPRQRRRARLVTGADERHELIAQVLVAHRVAIVVSSVDQHGEDVVAVTVAGSTPRR